MKPAALPPPTDHLDSPVGRPDRRRWLARALALAAGRAAGAAAATLPWTTAALAQAGEGQAPPLPTPGSRLVLPAAELLDGRRFEPAAAEGRVLLLYWWASWCPFCALTSPHVDALWRAEQQRPNGLVLLTFSIDKDADTARAYLARRNYAWPTAWAGPALQRALPKPKGLPVTVVRGRDGRVVQAEGGQLFPEDVEALARHAG